MRIMQNHLNDQGKFFGPNVEYGVDEEVSDLHIHGADADEYCYSCVENSADFKGSDRFYTSEELGDAASVLRSASLYDLRFRAKKPMFTVVKTDEHTLTWEIDRDALVIIAD